jgi:3'-phosphoadenosine 5'-phosphosulfate sulfotransferase (PAPS reductase)/FAD synthetase
MKIAWFSAGVTSAVACKLAIENMDDVRCFYIETGSHHVDNLRFLRDCEAWFGQKIEIAQSKKYSSVSDLILTRRFINGPKGVLCTTELKKEIRRRIHRELKPEAHIMGFEYSEAEIERARLFTIRHPEASFIYPLIEFKLDKNECARIVKMAGIELPEMYKLGYDHNNCIGCVKGGMGYWNKIRVDFPDEFAARAAEEREIGRSCMKGMYLDELPIGAGNFQKEVMPECGLFCQHEFSKIISHA